jgi:colicin import membrane protein
VQANSSPAQQLAQRPVAGAAPQQAQQAPLELRAGDAQCLAQELQQVGQQLLREEQLQQQLGAAEAGRREAHEQLAAVQLQLNQAALEVQQQRAAAATAEQKLAQAKASSKRRQAEQEAKHKEKVEAAKAAAAAPLLRQLQQLQAARAREEAGAARQEAEAARAAASGRAQLEEDRAQLQVCARSRGRVCSVVGLAAWLPGCLAAWLPGCLARCPAAVPPP